MYTRGRDDQTEVNARRTSEHKARPAILESGAYVTGSASLGLSIS